MRKIKKIREEKTEFVIIETKFIAGEKRIYKKRK